MEITCDKCQKKIVIPDGKIPPGRTASLQCPKCRTRLSVTGPEEKPAPDFSSDAFSFDEGDEAEEAPAAREEEEGHESAFDFIEETQKSALICNMDPELHGKLKKDLELLEYHVDIAENTRESLKKLRYHTFDLIMITDPADVSESSGVVNYLENLPMEIRRNMFVILYSNRFKSVDHMAALSLSVNLIIGPANLKNAAGIISRRVTENDLFYRVFKDAQAKLYE